MKDYDLFIYSEDDTLIKQRNIEAFLKVTEVLPEDKIAGFLRYEENLVGKKHFLLMPDIHAFHHWIPCSVKSFGDYTFAQFTNDHSACYMLTQDQLVKAIASGGFLVAPHEGRYDLLCTAATDAYTQCGFTRVICISHIQDFLIHHLSNRHQGPSGIESSELQLQINTLLSIKGEKEAQSELLPTRTNFQLNINKWDKHYYGKCKDNVLASVPDNARNILSVGCGWGATEAKLVQRGVRVVGIPLDFMIAESAKNRGIEVVCPDFEKAKETLANEKFDCILFIDVLQHLPDPVKILTEYTELLDKEGYVITSVPNFKYVRYLYEIFAHGKLYKNSKISDKTHIHFTTARMVAKWLGQSGLRVIKVKHNMNNRIRRFAILLLGVLKGYLAHELLFVARNIKAN